MATNTASAFGPSERTVLATKHCVDGAICLLHGEYEMSAAALEASLSHRPGDASALSLLRLAHRCTSDAARLPVLGLLAQANAYVRLLGHSDIVVARDVCRSLPFEARAAAASAEGAARSQLHEFASAMPDVAASLVAAANQYVDRAYASCGQPDAIGLYAFASRLWSGGVSARRKPAQMHTATEELELARACYEAAMRIQPAAANAAARGLERVHDLCLRKGVASAAATGHPIPSPSGRSVDALAGTAAACEADLSGSHACGLRNDAASVTNTTKRLGWSDLLAEWEALDSVPGSAAGSRRRVRAIACELLAAPDGEGFARLLRADGWPVMIGNRLGITADLFDELAAVVHLDGDDGCDTCFTVPSGAAPESLLCQIMTDLRRTLPAHGALFSSASSPYSAALVQLLVAFASYNPDLGYKQGMSFVAAMLLLHTDRSGFCDGADVHVAFRCLCNLVDRSPLFALYRLRSADTMRVTAFFSNLLCELDPVLAAHLGCSLPGAEPQDSSLDVLQNCCSLFLLDWILTLWCKALPPTLATWVWDNLLARGFGNAGAAEVVGGGGSPPTDCAATGAIGTRCGGQGEEWGFWLSASVLIVLRSSLLAARSLEQAAGLLRATSVSALFTKGERDAGQLPTECHELLALVPPAQSLISTLVSTVARIENGMWSSAVPPESSSSNDSISSTMVESESKPLKTGGGKKPLSGSVGDVWSLFSTFSRRTRPVKYRLLWRDFYSGWLKNLQFDDHIVSLKKS